MSLQLMMLPLRLKESLTINRPLCLRENIPLCTRSSSRATGSLIGSGYLFDTDKTSTTRRDVVRVTFASQDHHDLGPSICRPPAIARPRHWSSPLHLHAVTPLPGPARPTNMLPSNRRPRTTHPHGFPTTGSALAICHSVLRWPCCHPSLASTCLV